MSIALPFSPEIPLMAYKQATINASATTASVVLWTITGNIELFGLFGIVTTALSSNHTAAHFRLSDGTTTPSITNNIGVPLGSFSVNGILVRNHTASNFLAVSNAVTNPPLLGNASSTTGTLTPFTSCVLTAKSGATVNIEYRYTTTNTPATGVIDFYIFYRPMSSTATLV